MNRRQLAGCAVAMIAASLLFVVEPAAGPASGAVEGGPGGASNSAVTVHGKKLGYEDFSKMAITVSKTRDLTNEAITVNWTDATPTPRRGLGTDFLQIMQCWGDPDAADFRETCMFGMGLETPKLFAPRGGLTATSDKANLREMFVDPPDPTYPVPDPQEPLKSARMVPFKSVRGERSKDGGSPGQEFGRIKLTATTDRSETSVDVMSRYVSAETTNEIPYALTGGDRTGRAVFEVQNDLFSPHLGCGAAIPAPGGGQMPRPCSLVIVPRGHFNPYTGEDVTLQETAVHGSPFSPPIWQNRIVVPLEFAPVEGSCPLDKAEVDTAGTEVVAEAMTSWKPAICAGNGPVMGYNSMSDFEAGNRVTSTNPGAPGLVFTPEPVASTSPALVYAPVTVSSTVVAINIDYDIINPSHVTGAPTPEEFERLRGLSVSDLKLTPRLMAKLLTGSYTRSAMGPILNAEGFEVKNPNSIRFDPEFLTLNPAFAHWNRDLSATLDGLMVTATNSVSTREVWSWILSDPEAKAWLGGAADEYGMVVNQRYKNLFTTPPDMFPKADNRCVSEVGWRDQVEYRLCEIERFPYVGSFNEAALQTLRAQAKVKESVLRPLPGEPPTWDQPPLHRFPELPRKSTGSRFAMSITDSASAARYSLFTAKLCKPKRDANHDLVMPDDCRSATPDAVSAAVANATVPSAVEAAPVIDPAKAWATPGAYPLSTITYAIGDTSESAEARRDFATLLRYAAGSGQEPGQAAGQLPDGYVPLTAAMREQTNKAAGTLENWVNPPSAPPPGGTDGGGGGPTTNPNPTTTDGVPSAGASPSGSPGTPAPGVQPSADRASQSTLGSPLGIIRFILIVALIAGLVGGVAGPIMQRFATRSGKK